MTASESSPYFIERAANGEDDLSAAGLTLGLLINFNSLCATGTAGSFAVLN